MGRSIRFSRALFLILLIGAPLSEAYAETRTWSATASSNLMSNSSNWVGGVAPVAGDDIVFTGTSTFMNPFYDLAGSPGSILFESTGWQLNGSVPGSISVGSGGIRCTAADATVIISANLQAVGHALNLDAASGCTMQISGQLLSTSDGVSVGEFGGTGTVRFMATNSLSGPIRVRNGLLDCQTNTCLRNSTNVAGTGTVIELGAALRIAGNVEDEHLTLNGGNGLGSGALYTDTGLGWFGPMVLNADTSIGGAGNIVLSEGISGAGGLTKVGSGTMGTSTVDSDYAGPTAVSAGRLNLNGKTATSSTVVESGATLGGIGTVTNGAVVNSGGRLAPGTSAGILNTGTLALASGSTFEMEVNGTTPGTGYDQANVTGAVELGGATLSVILGFSPAPGDSFTIVANDDSDPVVDTFSGLAEGATFGVNGTEFAISYAGGTGNDVVLTVVSAVPTLPSTLITAVMAVSLLALAAWTLSRRRRQFESPS